MISVLKHTSNASCQPDGWARGEREGYGGPRDVTSLSLSLPLQKFLMLFKTGEDWGGTGRGESCLCA